jgi:YD repeat-containing protein
MKPICVVAALVCFLTACQKQNLLEDKSSSPDLASARTKNGTNGKKFLLKEFVNDDAVNAPRHYLFFYAQNGRLDSIQVTGDIEFTYRVFYKGSRIDSVNLVENGTIVSTNTHFQYKGNRIIKFDYYCRRCGQPEEFPSVRTFEYDTKGHIIKAGDEQLNYDGDDNVLEWTKSFAPNSATYTYDSNLNPFYNVKDLFAIVVEEAYLWEYSFSKHNSISKTYAGGENVAYQNQYDDWGRLISKTFYDVNQNGNNSFSFTYY